MPLFDRLVDEERFEPQEKQPLRTLDVETLRESVRREIGRLLNTRCPVPEWGDSPGKRTSINYGIPNFSAMTSVNPKELTRLATTIESAIRAFEPRLQSPRVLLRASSTNVTRAEGAIQGHLAIDTVKEPVSFVLALDLRDNAEDVEVG